LSDHVAFTHRSTCATCEWRCSQRSDAALLLYLRIDFQYSEAMFNNIRWQSGPLRERKEHQGTVTEVHFWYTVGHNLQGDRTTTACADGARPPIPGTFLQTGGQIVEPAGRCASRCIPSTLLLGTRCVFELGWKCFRGIVGGSERAPLMLSSIFLSDMQSRLAGQQASLPQAYPHEVVFLRPSSLLPVVTYCIFANHAAFYYSEWTGREQ
jgi:hypothetical protein